MKAYHISRISWFDNDEHVLGHLNDSLCLCRLGSWPWLLVSGCQATLPGKISTRLSNNYSL